MDFIWNGTENLAKVDEQPIYEQAEKELWKAFLKASPQQSFSDIGIVGGRNKAFFVMISH